MLNGNRMHDPVSAGAFIGGSKPLAPQTLARWRCEGKGPRFHKLPNGAIRYDEDDLKEWLTGSVIADNTSMAA